MELSEMYAETRGRLLALGPTLSTEQLGAPLAATPPWTALDAFRHLTGVCADVLDGRLENAGTPTWTAEQLAARADRTIDDVCAEWRDRGPDLDSRIAEVGSRMGFVEFDAWTHQQDVLAAVGHARLHDEVLVEELAGHALTTFSGRYASSGAPTVRVAVGETDERVLGEGEPAVTLTTSPYELMRIVFGRRSERQVRAAGWDGPPDDVAAAIAAFHLFDHPAVDVED